MLELQASERVRRSEGTTSTLRLVPQPSDLIAF